MKHKDYQLKSLKNYVRMKYWKKKKGENEGGSMGGAGKEEPASSPFFTGSHVLLRMSFPAEEGLITWLSVLNYYYKFSEW